MMMDKTTDFSKNCSNFGDMITKEDELITNSTFLSKKYAYGNNKNKLYVLNSVFHQGFSFSKFSEIIVKDSVVHIPHSAALSNSRRLLFENCIIYFHYNRKKRWVHLRIPPETLTCTFKNCLIVFVDSYTILGDWLDIAFVFINSILTDDVEDTTGCTFHECIVEEKLLLAGSEIKPTLEIRWDDKDGLVVERKGRKRKKKKSRKDREMITT